MARILITSLKYLDKFARLLADLLREHGTPPLFLKGSLGAGKTALACRIASWFPGGEKAETGSPTFTICNYYPAKPPVLHCDLYRCQGNMPDEILEFMEQDTGQLIVEWAEYFSFPCEERLDISINVINDTRCLDIACYGNRAFSIAYALLPLWETIAGQQTVINRDI